MSKVTRREAIVGAAALAAAGGASHAIGAPPSGTWTPLANMPFPVQEIYPTADFRTGPNPKDYLLRRRGVLVNAGGLTPTEGFAFNTTDLVTAYDPLTNQWDWGTNLPEPRHHIALAFHDNYLFAIGGFKRNNAGGWQMQRNVWRIGDLREPRWRAMTSMPIPQAESVVVSAAGRLHVIGGRAPAGTQNSQWHHHIDTDRHWIYDAAADAWQPRAPLPTPRNSAAAAAVGRYIYVIGGRTVSDGNTPACEVYEPQSDRWQGSAPMPKPIRQAAPRGQSGLAAATWNGNIYVFGGEWPSGVYADVWEYDPREDKWRAVAAMPTGRARHGLGAVALSDGIYVVGGATGPNDLGTSPYLDRFAI